MEEWMSRRRSPFDTKCVVYGGFRFLVNPESAGCCPFAFFKGGQPDVEPDVPPKFDGMV
jgi:hypothetical protein